MANKKRRIKVLIVDDSIFMREALARSLASDPVLEVVATASDPYAARDKILEFAPHVMTLDVEMPRMNGIEFLKRLMPQYPIPVVVISAVGEKVLDALDAGAVDFVTKPDFRSERDLESFFKEVNLKVKIASTAKVIAPKKKENIMCQTGGRGRIAKNCIIAIGASTGGTEAIDTVIKAFTPNMPGTVVVQHMPPVFTAMYAERLNSLCAVEVKEAKTGDVITSGRVLIAPGDLHMRIKRAGDEYIVECFRGERVNGHCPSVDVLFYSAAKVAGDKTIGVILTGMGSDGAQGLLALRLAGGRTIGQDEQTSVVYGMPKAAYEAGAVQEQVPLEQIPGKLSIFAQGVR
jgi:two-component system chemotaxis response regulator CheB